MRAASPGSPTSLSQPPLAAELGRAPLVVFEVDGNLAGRPVSGDTDGAFCEAIGRLLSRCRQGQDEALSEHYRTALRERSPSSFRLVLEESAPARFVDVTLVPPNPEAPAAARLLAIFRDVTLQVQTEQKSHNDTQRLFAILEQLPGFCYTVDRNLVFTSSEGAGLTHLNLTDGQVVGMRLPELWGTEDLNYEPMACHLRALEGTPGTYRDSCMGRSLEYRIAPQRDTEGRIVGVTGVGVDVTEQERAREAQVKLTAQLRQAQKMETVGRLAGGVAHDFNNFLTCILGNLSLAAEAAQGDARVARHLSIASAAAESAAALTRQLLAFGRKQVIVPRPLDLSSLVERLQSMLKGLVGERISLRTRCHSALWVVKADPGQLEQVLVNLVVNARDAIEADGEILIETQNLELDRPTSGVGSELPPGKYVTLSVSDTGRGMSELVRAKLFEPFFTTKETGAGTGLGLSSVYGAIEQNGGGISVESELGKGSTFRVFLPQVDDELGQAEAPAATPATREPRGGSETILLVEDDPLVLELAECALQQLGYRVLPCSNPDDALHALGEARGKVDLLLTDVVMPRMNGKELAARAGALQEGVLVLYTSGYGEPIISDQGVLPEHVHFIAKPYRPAELCAKVRAILDGRRLAAQLEPGLAARGQLSGQLS